MNLPTVRNMIGAALLAALAACGGGNADAPSNSPLMSETTQSFQRAQAAPAGARDTRCEGCDPAADGLADEYRMRAARSAAADNAVQPAYPRVPASAVTVVEARAPESYGSALDAPAR